MQRYRERVNGDIEREDRERDGTEYMDGQGDEDSNFFNLFLSNY